MNPFMTGMMMNPMMNPMMTGMMVNPAMQTGVNAKSNLDPLSQPFGDALPDKRNNPFNRASTGANPYPGTKTNQGAFPVNAGSSLDGLFTQPPQRASNPFESSNPASNPFSAPKTTSSNPFGTQAPKGNSRDPFSDLI
mmetsp:Transcript_10807/g.10845  ORF Transcript_10807/g.10845 Transcript_10807/m.10845 type:complete len:138 (+) Transcript_10807:1-414(+)